MMKKKLLLLSTTIFYFLALLNFKNILGGQVGIFAVPTIILSAWFYGQKGGLISGISFFISTFLLTGSIFQSNLSFPLGNILGGITGIGIGVAIGMSRDSKKTLDKTQGEIDVLRLGLERSKDVIFITDGEGVITYANPAFTQTYGYTKEEWRGKTPRILKSRFQTKAFYKKLWDNLKLGKQMTYEITNKTKSGKFLIIESSANPIIGQNGQPLGFIAIQRDVTEQKQSQKELIRRTDDLQKLNNLMVGRELKMIELKKEVKSLKKN